MWFNIHKSNVGGIDITFWCRLFTLKIHMAAPKNWKNRKNRKRK